MQTGCLIVRVRVKLPAPHRLTDFNYLYYNDLGLFDDPIVGHREDHLRALDGACGISSVTGGYGMVTAGRFMSIQPTDLLNARVRV